MALMRGEKTHRDNNLRWYSIFKKNIHIHTRLTSDGFNVAKRAGARNVTVDVHSTLLLQEIPTQKMKEQKKQCYLMGKI